MKLIDRIVADSRDIALNHTAGLSLPQQVMMSMFSLSELMDEAKLYQKTCMGIVRARAERMIEGLGIEVPDNLLHDRYYGLIDFEFWANKYVGPEVVAMSWPSRKLGGNRSCRRNVSAFGFVALPDLFSVRSEQLPVATQTANNSRRVDYTTGTRLAASIAGEITSMSSGTCQRLVSRTSGAALPVFAPSSTKPS